MTPGTPVTPGSPRTRRSFGGHVLVWVAVAAALLGVVLGLSITAGAHSGDDPGPGSSSVPDLTSTRWIVSTAVLQHLAADQPTVAGHFFDGPAALVLGSPVRGVGAAAATKFTSYAAFADAVRAGTVARRSWVMYDDEKWPLTPSDEQRHPAAYLQRFAMLARQAGLSSIEAPARDLAAVPGADCAQVPDETLDHAYLRCRLPEAASSADVVEIQAQADQPDVGAYTGFLRAAVVQVHDAAPFTPVLAGLTTDRGDTAASVLAAWQAVRATVQGFWLNSQLGSASVAGDALALIQHAGG